MAMKRDDLHIHESHKASLGMSLCTIEYAADVSFHMISY